MKITQLKLVNNAWQHINEISCKPQLALLFGSRPTIEQNADAVDKLKKMYPNVMAITTSTSGNIMDDTMLDDTIVATCIELEKTTVKAHSFSLENVDGEQLGKNIANHFSAPNLVYLLLLSNVGVNAGNILKGINQIYKGKVAVSGGVAGDDTRFKKTLVGIDNMISSNQITAVGFYGENLLVTNASKGGWDTFGPIRKITKCKGNILYEIDNKPVLNLYKEYLGDKAKELPASGLLFPFTVIDDTSKEPIVRGIQNIDENENALILYGDVVEGQNIQLMRANLDNLIAGAGNAAKDAMAHQTNQPQLAILISCIARRLVLGQLIEEELTEVKNTFGKNTTLCGFYSYSELAPVSEKSECLLHNQTMTITTLSEI